MMKPLALLLTASSLALSKAQEDTFQGYWITTFQEDVRPSDGVDLLQAQPLQGGQLQGSHSRPYTLKQAFYHEDLQGSRYTSHRYYVMGPAPVEFCDDYPNQNVVGHGVCGVNGYSVAAAIYGTLADEGVWNVLKTGGWYTRPGAPRAQGLALQALDDDRTFVSSLQYGDILESTTSVLLNDNATLVGTKLFYNVADGTLLERRRFVSQKVSKDVWWHALQQAYVDNHVLREDQVPITTTSNYCLVDHDCPTEEEWCAQDPMCNNNNNKESGMDWLAWGLPLLLGVVAVVQSIVLYKVQRAHTQRSTTATKSAGNEPQDETESETDNEEEDDDDILGGVSDNSRV